METIWVDVKGAANATKLSASAIRDLCRKGDCTFFLSAKKVGHGPKARWRIRLKKAGVEHDDEPHREPWLAATPAILRRVLRAEKTKLGHGGLFENYAVDWPRELEKNTRGFHREHRRSPLVPREKFLCAYELYGYSVRNNCALAKHHYFISERVFDLVFPLAFGEEWSADIKSELTLQFNYRFGLYSGMECEDVPSNNKGYFLTSAGFDLAFGDSFGPELRKAIDKCRGAPTVRLEVTNNPPERWEIKIAGTSERLVGEWPSSTTSRWIEIETGKEVNL